MITPSSDQQAALDAILSWLESSARPRLTFGGWAGTGKSTLIGILRERLGTDVAICAPTGKAAHVLRTKGNGGATTVHGLIYKPFEECDACGRQIYDHGEDGESVAGCRPPCRRPSTTLRFQRVPEIAARLIVVDEASMISRDLMEDLESFGRRVLYVGDHGQLEPVGDDPGLMREPEVRLEKIHRQAEGDPIIRFAHALRTGSMPRAALQCAGSPNGVTPIRTDSGGLGVVNRVPSDLTKYEAILCGYNKTRVGMNYAVRRQLGFSGGTPHPNERVICLKNNREFGIFNGMQATVLEYEHREDKQSDLMTVITDDGLRIPSIPVDRRQFGARETLRDVHRRMNLFDFGYALTVHKCLAGDTLIETPCGWQRIDSIDGDRGHVSTVEGSAPFTKFVQREVGDLITLKCEGGYEITVTPDHHMHIFDAGAWVPVLPESIRPDQFMRLKLGAGPFSSEPAVLPSCPPGDVRARLIDFPNVMTPELAEFFGLMVADGTRFQRGIRLAKRYEEVVDRFCELVSSLFGLDAKRVRIGSTPGAELHSTLLSAWLKRVGGIDPHRKHIPSSVLKGPSWVRASFLKGLFEDGTVNVKDGAVDHVEWTNVDASVVRDVQTILLEFGIVSSTSYDRKMPSLYIYSDDISTFRTQIGFISHIKTKRLDTNKITRTRRWRVPVTMDDVANASASVRNNVRERGYVSRSLAKDLGMHKALGFHYVRMCSVMRSRGPSYCLTVPSTGAFLQRRFDGLNSQGSEWDRVLVIEEIGRSWSPDRWRYTASTRAAKGLVWVL